MKPRFTFQYLYHFLFLNAFHQAQGMKTNSAALFVHDQLLVGLGQHYCIAVIKRWQNADFWDKAELPILTFSSLQLKMRKYTGSARRAREGIAAFISLRSSPYVICTDSCEFGSLSLFMCQIVFVAWSERTCPRQRRALGITFLAFYG